MRALEGCHSKVIEAAAGFWRSSALATSLRLSLSLHPEGAVTSSPSKLLTIK
jgi:hypothetical protein